MIVVVGWIASLILLAIPEVRSVFAQPLCVHEPDATGEVAYVMAGGKPYYERLRAASGLFHTKRVSRIIILDERWPAGYSHQKRRTITRVERAVDYLAFHGVPAEKIDRVPPESEPLFGSLSEARSIAANYPNLSEIVVVTSAPHTRRSRLCFQRTLPAGTEIHVYAASTPLGSGELWHPIWVEYVKMAVYFVVA